MMTRMQLLVLMTTWLLFSWIGPVATQVKADEKTKQAAKHYFNNYMGKQPPELKGLASHWVNKTEPVTLEKLHGRVVWLEFNF